MANDLTPVPSPTGEGRLPALVNAARVSSHEIRSYYA